jgi:hypothetical protein
MAGFQTKTQRAYTAGLIDGEGCIRIHKQNRTSSNPGVRYYVEIRVAMTDETTIRTLQSMWGGFVGERNYKYESSFGNKKQWVWRVSTAQARYVLEAIKPYMITKRSQAITALELPVTPHRGRGIKTTPEELLVKETLYLKIKELKV